MTETKDHFYKKPKNGKNSKSKKVSFRRSKTTEHAPNPKIKSNQMDLTNHTIRNERNFLHKCIKSSELLKLKAKIGNIVTKVDHSDIIVEGKLHHMSKNLLKQCGFDPELYTLEGKHKLINPRPEEVRQKFCLDNGLDYVDNTGKITNCLELSKQIDDVNKATSLIKIEDNLLNLKKSKKKTLND